MSQAPWTLNLHALSVLAVSLLAPGHDGGALWFGLVMTVLMLWWLFLGSRFAWWIQVVALCTGLAGVAGVWSKYPGDTYAISVFVPPLTLTAISVLLVAAAVLLLHPETRRYCSQRSDGPRSALGIAVGAFFMSWFPATALSLESRLPSNDALGQEPNLVFVGSDRAGPTAFYAGGVDGKRCYVFLSPRSSSSGCSSGRISPGYVHGHGTEDVTAWVLPKRIVRVEVVYETGVSNEARLLDGSEHANLFYVTEHLDEIAGITAYDSQGNEVIRCRPC